MIAKVMGRQDKGGGSGHHLNRFKVTLTLCDSQRLLALSVPLRLHKKKGGDGNNSSCIIRSM